jgi:ribosomal protein S18 acetylase RimI-like enzyme
MSDDDMVGFGCWKHRTRDDGERVIVIAYLALDQQFFGAVLPGGTKIADALYATLEADALADPNSTADMPIDLFCDTENARGITFWRRQGFEILGQTNGKARPNQYHWMRRRAA